MKKQILTVSTIVLLALGSTTFLSCENQTSDSEVVETAYYCPMKCEGEKTYADKDTKCPTCGMDLVEVE